MTSLVRNGPGVHGGLYPAYSLAAFSANATPSLRKASRKISACARTASSRMRPENRRTATTRASKSRTRTRSCVDAGADLAPSANDDGSWSVPGGCSIRDLSDQFNLVLQETESATVGGYVVEHLGRVPQAGEAFVIDNTRVTITKANQRRIREINLVLEVTDGE